MLKHFGRQLRRVLRVSSNVRKDESGAALVEYALLAAIIGVGSLVATTNLATQLTDAMNYTSCKVSLTNPTLTGTGAGSTCTWGGNGAAS